MGTEVMTSFAASQILMEMILDKGMPLKDFERQTGISRIQIEDPDARIPMSSFLNLWQIAIDLTGDPALALHLRKKVGLRIVHFVVSLAQHSSNLLEAMFHLSQYAKLMSDTDKFDVFDEDGLITIVYTNTAPEYQNRWIPEHHFSLGLRIGRSLVSREYNPLKVHFQHADPGYPEAYAEVFRSPILFQQPENMVVLKKKDLLQPIASRDPYLQKIFKKHAELLLKKLDGSESLQGKVCEQIMTHLPQGGTDIKKVSRAMNMDRSTLYRQLKLEGTTFKNLLLKTRQELAKSHLRQGMTNSQVAYLLGFSEPAAFQRAFKRWVAISPGEYRKSL
ncbi:MAG: AraC family transcriptional regulator [Desulfobacteraceae bacterium]|nr:AraC family transcriptional regulator [Desulfobacteraceae bacterium]MBC2753995.1 AraC family transcriptional regulator [Desulfobacteraceae bacterium]